ncbi:MAG: B12-binding domain-containing radical SAM protein [Halobacteriota archaeon]
MGLDIALIHPPFGKGDVRKLGICSPPIGLAYLGAFLRESDHRVSIIDAEAEGLNKAQILERVNKADLVGITTTAPAYNSALELTNLIKQSHNKTTVVLGGPQATFLDRECLERSAADAVVRGEGESTMLDIATSIESGDISDVEGTTARDGDTIIRNPERKLIADLDDIPFPARDLLPLEKYLPVNSAGIVSSRGCPFRCIFCASSKLYDKKFRSRSAQNVFQEVAQLVDQGYTNVTMLDDNFILNKERAFEFADLVEASDLKFNWSCTGRVDSIDEDLLRRLREVGCNGLFFGVESASNDTLKLIKKGFTTDQVINAFDVLKNYDYPTTASFMIGLPGDDPGKVADTINLAKQIKPDFAMFSVTTPYPGTELYENIDNYDLEITIDDWSKFTLTKPVVRTDALSTADLHWWFIRAYFSFYVRASYITRAIARKQLGFVLNPVKSTIADAFRGTIS